MQVWQTISDNRQLCESLLATHEKHIGEHSASIASAKEMVEDMRRQVELLGDNSDQVAEIHEAFGNIQESLGSYCTKKDVELMRELVEEANTKLHDFEESTAELKKQATQYQEQLMQV